MDIFDRKRYLFGCLKSRDTVTDPFTQFLRSTGFLRPKSLSKRLELVNSARDAPPRIRLERRVALPIESEMGIVTTLNKPVTPFVTITSPRLDGQRLVAIPFLSLLLVALLELGLDGFGGGKGPEDQRFEERQLDVT